MSAIEVLKEWLDKPIIFDEIFMTKEDYIEQVNLKVATKEAIVALEKQEKLVEWLEKRIEANEKRLNWQRNRGDIMFSAQICEGLEQRIFDLKEVLERVGE